LMPRAVIALALVGVTLLRQTNEPSNNLFSSVQVFMHQNIH
jgi:hypothetical protein